MNLHRIELFLAVVDAGGFTAAAERRGIAQPAVSAAVRKLEDELGVLLLVRGRRRLTLTAAGTAFLRHARAVLAQLAASRRELAAMQSLEVGQLAIGAPAMVAGHLLPPLIDGFLKQRPGLRLTIVQAGAEEIGGRVLRGELDLGITADWRTPEGLVTQVLEVQAMVACVAAASPLASRRRLGWAELLDQRLIMFPRGYYQRSRVEDAAARLRRALDIAVEAESLPLVVDLVRRGHGVATLLAAAAVDLPGIATLALPAEATVPVAVCRRADAPPNAAVEAFHAWLLRHARGRLGGALARATGDHPPRAQPTEARARRR